MMAFTGMKITVFPLLMVALMLVTGVRAQSNYRRLTNLPHVYINTFDGKDVTSKKEEVFANLYMVDEKDSVAVYDSIVIRGRGNSTWNLEKKPYRIKFKEKTRFLGPDRANAKKWTLLANHGDKSLIRNALASYIGDLCGQVFTPGAKFVDLTMNGVYQGCYQISDQIEVRKKRVDVEEQSFTMDADANVTGGYLLEADGFCDFLADGNGWWTAQYVPMTIHYPDKDQLTQQQINYIRGYVHDFETRLFSDNYQDPEAGYRAWVDSTSLVSWYLASEVTGNPDFLWSMYCYKDRDDNHLFFGPMWDYDIAFNNDKRLNDLDPVHRLMVEVGYPNTGLVNWMNRMWSDPWFQRLVYRNYSALYCQGLEEKIVHAIDSLDVLLKASQELNYQKWEIDKRKLGEVVIFSTYEEYIDDLRQYVSERVKTLFQTFSDRRPPGDPEYSGMGHLGMAIVYALAYDAEGKRLHFGADDLSQLTFFVSVYDSSGRKVLQFPASEGARVTSLRPGLYVVLWEDHGPHSAKFIR